MKMYLYIYVTNPKPQVAGYITKTKKIYYLKFSDKSHEGVYNSLKKINLLRLLKIIKVAATA